MALLLPYLPMEIIERIADFADIDTRRSLGFKPRKINKDIISNMESLLKRHHESRFYYNDHVFTTLLPVQKVSQDTITTLFIWFDKLFDTMNIMVAICDINSLVACNNKSCIFADVVRLYYVNPKRSIGPIYQNYSQLDFNKEMITMTTSNAQYCLDFETR